MCAQHIMLNKINSHQYRCTEAHGSSQRTPKETLVISLTHRCAILAQDDDEYAGVVVFLQMSYLNVHVSMLVCVSVCKFAHLHCVYFFTTFSEKGGGLYRASDNNYWLFIVLSRPHVTALCGWTKGSIIRPYRKQKKSIAACCAMASLK